MLDTIGKHVMVMCLFYLGALKASKLRGAIGRHIRGEHRPGKRRVRLAKERGGFAMVRPGKGHLSQVVTELKSPILKYCKVIEGESREKEKGK